MGEASGELLARLAPIDWFRAVGQPGGTEVTWLGGWPAAFTHLARYAESRGFVAPVNHLRRQVRERCPDQYPGWAAVADAIRPRITALVSAKTDPLACEPSDRKLLSDMLAWDVMHACMESEFGGGCGVRYHRERVALLEAGHCPCGWSGEFPAGRHVAV